MLVADVKRENKRELQERQASLVFCRFTFFLLLLQLVLDYFALKRVSRNATPHHLQRAVLLSV